MTFDQCLTQATEEVKSDSECYALIIVKNLLSETPDAPFEYCPPAAVKCFYKEGHYKIVGSVRNVGDGVVTDFGLYAQQLGRALPRKKP